METGAGRLLDAVDVNRHLKCPCMFFVIVRHR